MNALYQRMYLVAIEVKHKLDLHVVGAAYKV